MNISRPQLLQDPFLNALRKQKVPLSVYLTNGIKLQGHISAFDSQVVLLKNNTKQMVFKHAIATIVPSRNVVWNDYDSSNEMDMELELEDALDEEEAVENY